jgi:hypothetical protein
MDTLSKYASSEELRYAKVLDIGVKAGFVLLVLSFATYLTGILPPHIAFDQLPMYWGLPVSEFVKATNTPTGWGWLRLIAKGDIVNLVVIAYMAGLSAICCLAVLPIFARRGEKVQLVLAVLQIAVLVLAASDILTAGR